MNRQIVDRDGERDALRLHRSTGQPLPFAPGGETTIHDSLVRAINQAREYIYIEDQYFTPPSNPLNDPQHPLNPEVFFDALEMAADHCKRLIVVGPTGGGGQPFGLDRRRYLLSRLTQAWGDRFIAGGRARTAARRRRSDPPR